MISLCKTNSLRYSRGTTSCYCDRDSRGIALKLGDYVLYAESQVSNYVSEELVTVCKMYTDGLVDVVSGCKIEIDYNSYIFKISISKHILAKLKNLDVGLRYRLLHKYTGDMIQSACGADLTNKLTVDYFNRKISAGDFVYFADNKNNWDCGVMCSDNVVFTHSLTKRKISAGLVYKKDELSPQELEICKNIYKHYMIDVQGRKEDKTLYKPGNLYISGKKLYLYAEDIEISITDGKYAKNWKKEGIVFIELSNDVKTVDMSYLNSHLNKEICDTLLINSVLRSIHCLNLKEEGDDKYRLSKPICQYSCFSTKRLVKPIYIGDYDVQNNYYHYKTFKYKGSIKTIEISIKFGKEVKFDYE